MDNYESQRKRIYDELSPGADYEHYLSTGELPTTPWDRAGGWLVLFLICLMVLALVVAVA